MYQYERSNLRISDQLILALAARATFGCEGRFVSSQRSAMAARRPVAAIPAASTSGSCQPASYSGRAQVGDLSSDQDPTRARLKYTDVASAIPLLGNHCARPATSEM